MSGTGRWQDRWAMVVAAHVDQTMRPTAGSLTSGKRWVHIFKTRGPQGPIKTNLHEWGPPFTVYASYWSVLRARTPRGRGAAGGWGGGVVLKLLDCPTHNRNCVTCQVRCSLWLELTNWNVAYLSNVHEFFTVQFKSVSSLNYQNALARSGHRILKKSPKEREGLQLLWLVPYNDYKSKPQAAGILVWAPQSCPITCR